MCKVVHSPTAEQTTGHIFNCLGHCQSWGRYFKNVQLSLRVRSHGLLVYRLCLLPDTPIIFIYLFKCLGNVTSYSYILLCQKVTRYILLVTFQSNIIRNLVTSYLYFAYDCA